MGSITFGLVPVRREDEPAWQEFAAVQLKGTLTAAALNGSLQRVLQNQGRGGAGIGRGLLGGRGRVGGADAGSTPER